MKAANPEPSWSLGREGRSEQCLVGMDAVGSQEGWGWVGYGVHTGQWLAEEDTAFSTKLHLHEGLLS